LTLRTEEGHKFSQTTAGLVKGLELCNSVVGFTDSTGKEREVRRLRLATFTQALESHSGYLSQPASNRWQTFATSL